MAASKQNPVYTAYAISAASGKKYDLTAVIEQILLSDKCEQFAQRATIQIANQQKVDNSWLSSILKVRDRIFIFADDGERKDEVFRGYIWTRPYNSQNDGKSLKIQCYDNLIYMQESEDSEFFSSGKSSKDIVSALFNKWGIPCEYTYSSITHEKMPLRGKLSDIITGNVLNLVKERTGKKYVIRSEKDTVKIMPTGTNTKYYTIQSREGGGALSVSSECTMDGMTTQVVIIGKEDENQRAPVEATVKGDTSKYGTIQTIVQRDENTQLSDAKKEAQNTINKDGKPKWKYEVEAVDIPWIRKGDQVKVSAGDMTSTYIVTGVDRTIRMTSKTMTLQMENKE